MLRPRTSSSATATPSSGSLDTPSLALLSDTGSRSRAVENDYSDHPIVHKTPSGSQSDVPRQRERLHGRESGQGHLRYSRPRHHHHHQHPRGESGRSRRIPGSAARVNAPSLSLPSYLVSRESRSDEAPLSNPLDGGHPVIPPRPYPLTVGHYPSRRRTWEQDPLLSRPAPPLPDQGNLPVTVIRGSSTPPPRPPPPPPDVAARLGVPIVEVRSTTTTVTSIGVRTTQPSIRTAPLSTSDVVTRQPNSTRVNRSDSKDDKTVKSSRRDRRADEKKETSDVSKSPSHRSLKKSEPQSYDSDHQLMDPGSGEGRSVPKPGEHNYQCPRCGKCTCPSCQGDSCNTSAHCWMCNHRCLCNVDTCVEAATCLCCVRGCFYHCSNYDDDDSCTDKPCSCRGTSCCLRWSALSALSLVLPCLLCYPVLRGCVRACRSCADCMKPGCRCKESYR